MRELTMTESLMIAFDVFARVGITATPSREDRPYRLVLRSKRKIHFFVLAGLAPAIHLIRHTPLPFPIGIGGSLTAPPLPHHGVYGSVHGGSVAASCGGRGPGWEDRWRTREPPEDVTLARFGRWSECKGSYQQCCRAPRADFVYLQQECGGS
jgi:hypothetical protein